LRAKWFYSIVAASALTLPAFSQIQIYIGPPPPVIRYEVRPPMPAESFIWTDGYWGAHGGRYVWVPGHYMAPRRGYHWVPDHYDRRGPRYHYVPGGWVR